MSRLFIALCALGTLAMLGWHAYWSLHQGRMTPGFDHFFLTFIVLLALPYVMAVLLLVWRNGRAGLRHAFGAALVNALWAIPLAVLLVLFAGFTMGNRDQEHQLAAVAIAAVLQIAMLIVAATTLWRGRAAVRGMPGVARSWMFALALPALASGTAWIYFNTQTQAFKSRSAQAAQNSRMAQETVKLLQTCLDAGKDTGYPAKLPPCPAATSRMDFTSGYRFEYLPALPDQGRIGAYMLCAQPLEFRASGFEVIAADATGFFAAAASEQLPPDQPPTCASVLGAERAIVYCAYEYAARSSARGYPARLANIAPCISVQRTLRERGNDRLVTERNEHYAYVADAPDARGHVAHFRIHRLGASGNALWIDEQQRVSEKKAPTSGPVVKGLTDAAEPEKFETGCAEGRAGDCFLAGYEWQRRARAMAQDERDESARPLRETAIKALARGCELGDARSCAWMASDIEHGIGAERDVAAALQFYEKSCALGYSTGCRNAAQMHETGRQAQPQTLLPQPRLRSRIPKADVPQNASLAAEFYGRACTVDDNEACFIAARLFGEGVAMDREKSLTLFAKLCNDGMTLACTRAAALDEDRAADFKRRACALGDQSACSAQK